MIQQIPEWIPCQSVGGLKSRIRTNGMKTVYRSVVKHCKFEVISGQPLQNILYIVNVFQEWIDD
jgi:hypothetical protein